MEKINLAEATAYHESRVERFAYKVTEPKTKRLVHFELVVQRTDEGEYCDSSIEVDSSDVIAVVGLKLFGTGYRKHTEDLRNMLTHCWALDGWGYDGFDFYASLSEDEFFELIPDGVKELGVGMGENGEYCWGGIDIKWEEIDWFGVSEDDPGQRCLEYVERILNIATEHCANEWNRRHKE